MFEQLDGDGQLTLEEFLRIIEPADDDAETAPERTMSIAQDSAARHFAELAALVRVRAVDAVPALRALRWVAGGAAWCPGVPRR